MASLSSYWAKSPAKGRATGESLTDHLHAAYLAAHALAARIGAIGVVDDIAVGQFWRIVALAAILHDAGKIAGGFQDMVKGRIRVWPQRHEVLSLGFIPWLVQDEKVRDWISVAVATHHRSLTSPTGDGRKSSLDTLYRDTLSDGFDDEIGDVDSQAATELLGWIAATAGLTTKGRFDEAGTAVVASAEAELETLLARWTRPVDPAAGLAAVLLQGAVTVADHLSSAHGSLDSVQPINANFHADLHRRLNSDGRTIHAHQDRAANIHGHMILRAPTGRGKTEAGLLWAAAQLGRIAAERGCVPRLFYTLPYLASINAMTGRLGGQLGSGEHIGVAHSRAGSYHLAEAIEPADGEADTAPRRDLAAHKALARVAATRLFRETVRVGTPYQLLRGALAGPIHAGVLLDSVNSVFLLDELHAYDARRLGFILAAISFWERVGGSIGVLSATMPDVLIELIRSALVEHVEVIDGHRAGDTPRHRIRISAAHLTDESTIERIRRNLAGGAAVLVVANTVAQARELFAALGPTTEELHGPDGAHLLHSRFTRRDRGTIEKAVMNRYGTAAPRRGGLLVATQVIEVSLDLDFDVMYTSGAPLEALLQRFGRVNRLGRRAPAEVIVHEPEYKARGKDAAERADGIYEAQPTRHALEILSRHDGEPVDERAAVGWLNEIYNSPWGDAWRREVDDFRQRFTTDFLTFTTPFDDRSDLEQSFDTLFDGTEAILASDIDDYRAALNETSRPAAGRLLAEELLIPVPLYTRPRYDRRLRVSVIDAEYDPRTGLGALRDPSAVPRYAAGEIL